MDDTRLATQYEKFGLFEGTWEGEEHLAPSPWAEAGRARGRATYRLSVAGTVAVQDYVQERDGQTVFEGHGVFTVDPSDGSVLWYLFDSFGFPPLEPARRVWEGDTLLLSKRTPRGETRHSFRFEDDRYHYRIENRLAGDENFSVFLTATYLRRG